jgi:hypothetical protein
MADPKMFVRVHVAARRIFFQPSRASTVEAFAGGIAADYC